MNGWDIAPKNLKTKYFREKKNDVCTYIFLDAKHRYNQPLLSLPPFVRPTVGHSCSIYMGRINVSCGLNFCTINITGKQIVF